MSRYAAYIRTPTTKQTTGARNRRSTILEWFADRDEYVDAAQLGVDDSCEAFCELLDTVRDGYYYDVMAEIGRLGPLFVHS